MPTLTISELRAGWIELTRQKEFFYLLVFIALVVLVANTKNLCKIAAIPLKIALSVAGTLIGFAVLWGLYRLFVG